MSQTIHFTKMQGAGNDYIYINTLLYTIPDPVTEAIKWSSYHTGIGSDGLILIGKPEKETNADFSMRIFNADGSEAMMCGNGSRCVGKYLYEKGKLSRVISPDVLLIQIDICGQNIFFLNVCFLFVFF